MRKDKQALLDARRKWESDINKYKEFLKGEIQTFDGRLGAEEYIELAKNQIEIIDLELALDSIEESH